MVIPLKVTFPPRSSFGTTGTRVNQKPGTVVTRPPGIAETINITEVTGTDAQGNNYQAASKLVKATLKDNSNSTFTLTLQNAFGGTANEAPLRPGVWSVSYMFGGALQAPNPLYTSGKPNATSCGVLQRSWFIPKCQIKEENL